MNQIWINLRETFKCHITSSQPPKDFLYKNFWPHDTEKVQRKKKTQLTANRLELSGFDDDKCTCGDPIGSGSSSCLILGCCGNMLAFDGDTLLPSASTSFEFSFGNGLIFKLLCEDAYKPLHKYTKKILW